MSPDDEIVNEEEAQALQQEIARQLSEIKHNVEVLVESVVSARGKLDYVVVIGGISDTIEQIADPSAHSIVAAVAIEQLAQLRARHPQE